MWCALMAKHLALFFYFTTLLTLLYSILICSVLLEGVFLVFEYCEHDLSALLDQVRSPFSESEVKSLVFQLLSAVAYFHEHWIIHRGMCVC